jgi:hypothetical protein
VQDVVREPTTASAEALPMSEKMPSPERINEQFSAIVEAATRLSNAYGEARCRLLQMQADPEKDERPQQYCENCRGDRLQRIEMFEVMVSTCHDHPDDDVDDEQQSPQPAPHARSTPSWLGLANLATESPPPAKPAPAAQTSSPGAAKQEHEEKNPHRADNHPKNRVIHVPLPPSLGELGAKGFLLLPSLAR